MTDTGINLSLGMGGIYTALIYRANDKVRQSQLWLCGKDSLSFSALNQLSS